MIPLIGDKTRLGRRKFFILSSEIVNDKFIAYLKHNSLKISDFKTFDDRSKAQLFSCQAIYKDKPFAPSLYFYIINCMHI